MRLPRPRTGQVLACLSLLSLTGLSFVLGAAVIHFQLPPAAFLDKAFTGAQAWQESRQSPNPPPGGWPEGTVTADKPGKTSDGFTLYTTIQGARATLLDMRGNVVHRWELPFRQVWPQAPHVPRPVPEEQIHWFRCHLFPNGDLLAVYHGEGGEALYGYGLVKVDKDSKLLWAYPGRVHHDLDVAEDGTIYTLTHQVMGDPPDGLGFLPRTLIADSLVVLSPEGRERETIPILEAFRDSPYALMLTSLAGEAAPGGARSLPALAPPPPPPGPPRAVPVLPSAPPAPGGLAAPSPPPPPALSAGANLVGDLMHTNAVRVLGRAVAPHFPLFKPGQVLLSLRNLDALAVLDRPARSVTWAARGVWRLQHDPEFLDNGHLLLYDNAGWAKGARVLEYDPVRQALPWAYANEDSAPFRALYRGVKQRLANGNTLIVDPDNGRLFEVTAAKELVWEVHCPPHVTSARRYRPQDLAFLPAGTRPRP